MQWPFGRKQDDVRARVNAILPVIDRLLDAEVPEKRAILEQHKALLLSSDAIFSLYVMVDAGDRVAERESLGFDSMSPQEREAHMRYGRAVDARLGAQDALLHLSLLRDARDQGIPTAFRFFEESYNHFLASRQVNFDGAATRQALTDLFNAIIEHRTWEATRAVLTYKSDLLLNGLAEFLIEKDSENIREGVIPSQNQAFDIAQNQGYGDLLRDSRQFGIAYAWPRFQQRVREIAAQFPKR